MASGALLDKKIEDELAKGKQGRLARLRQSRAFRTFARDRGALVASAVIGLYIAVAVLIVGSQLAALIADRLGADLSDTFIVRELSLARSLERVGPNSLPGFLEEPGIDDRLEHAEFFLDTIERALERQDADRALDAIDFAERDVIDAPPQRVAELLDAAYAEFDELDAVYFEREDLLDTIAFAQEDGDARAADEARARLDAVEERLQAELADLERAVGEILPLPEGFAGVMYDARLLLGTDKQGRSILWRAIYSIRVATQVGLVSAIIAVCFGSVLGAAAGFFGGWVDHAVVWLYSTLSSVPYIVLLTVVAFVFSSMDVTVPLSEGVKVSQTLIPMYVAFGVTFWIAPCRQIRGEAIKIRSLDYVQSATALGAGKLYILRRHVIPNVLFLVFINFSLIFIGAIKSEVILSFLGIGVQGQPSWGVMISESKSEVLNQFFWQIGAATAFMFGLVLAFNVFSDALQDAFDPKHAR